MHPMLAAISRNILAGYALIPQSDHVLKVDQGAVDNPYMNLLRLKRPLMDPKNRFLYVNKACVCWGHKNFMNSH